MADGGTKIDETRLKKFLLSKQSGVDGGLYRAALRVQRGAKRLCPVDSGLLRASIGDPDNGGLMRVLTDKGERCIDIGSGLAYARRIELGYVGLDSLGVYHNQKPQPYLRPALLGAHGIKIDLSVLSASELKVRDEFTARRKLRVAARSTPRKRK